MTKMTIAALVAIAGALPACRSPNDDTAHVQLVSYRPDGSLVLCTAAGIYVYDGSLGTQINHIPLDALKVGPLGDDGEFWFTVSADGTTAAASYTRLNDPGAKSRIATYRIPDGHLLDTFELGGAPPPFEWNGVYEMALSPDGKLLYVSKGGSGVQMVDAVTGAPLWMDAIVRSLAAWSSDSATLFATNGDVTGGPDMVFSLDALDARTGVVKWSTDLHDAGITGLALVGDGTSLTGPGIGSTSVGCGLGDVCPPSYSFWSSADGTPTGQLPPLPHTALTGSNPRGFAGFACNAADTCAVRMSEFTPPPGPDWQTSFVRVYKTDGTELQRLPMGPGGASGQGSMAISPDGELITIADDWGKQGGAKVFSVDDGAIVASRTFP